DADSVEPHRGGAEHGGGVAAVPQARVDASRLDLGHNVLEYSELPLRRREIRLQGAPEMGVYARQAQLWIVGDGNGRVDGVVWQEAEAAHARVDLEVDAGRLSRRQSAFGNRLHPGEIGHRYLDLARCKRFRLPNVRRRREHKDFRLVADAGVEEIVRFIRGRHREEVDTGPLQHLRRVHRAMPVGVGLNDGDKFG